MISKQSSGAKPLMRPSAKRSLKSLRKQDAREEIAQFAQFADAAEPSSVEANRYAKKIWRRALKHKLSLGLLSRRICRSCCGWMVFGKNARVRVHNGKIIYRCMQCGHTRRILYKK